MASEQSAYDTILKGGTVIDPATGRNGKFDVGVLAGRICAIESALAPGGGTRVVDVAGKLVITGMIDTHAHVYEHVTGKFGLNADMVGVRSASTTLIDQGGPSCMTIRGFRHFVAEPASSRVFAFISSYLVGGLEGHYYPELYGPGGVNVDHTVRAIDENRDIVKGVKSHAGDRRRIALGPGGRQARAAHRARGGGSTLHSPRPALADRRPRDHRRG